MLMVPKFKRSNLCSSIKYLCFSIWVISVTHVVEIPGNGFTLYVIIIPSYISDSTSDVISKPEPGGAINFKLFESEKKSRHSSIEIGNICSPVRVKIDINYDISITNNIFGKISFNYSIFSLSGCLGRPINIHIMRIDNEIIRGRSIFIL